MATMAAKLLVMVGADVSEAQRKLNGMSKQFDTLRGGATKMAVGVTAAAASIGAAAVAFSAKAIEAGSDLAESQNKVRVVFGESAASIEAWASSAAQTLAMTQQQALEASGTFGNLFDSMGIAEQNASRMSQSMVQLAADLASFNNIGVDVALEKLQSGLVGETEPLRALGVNLSVVAAEAKALEMGLAATTAQLTAADMAQARYALIMEQTSNAQGDLARTSDGWANQMRILQANLADVTAEIGQRLLPAILPFFQKLVEFIQSIGPEVVRLVGEMVNGFSAMTTVIGNLDLSVPVGQFQQLQSILGSSVWGEVFGFVAKQIGLLVLNIQEAGMELERLGAEFGLVFEVLKGESSLSEFMDKLKALREEYAENRIALQDQYTAIKELDFTAAIDSVMEVNRVNAEATDWWQRHSDAMRQFNDQTATTADAAFSMASIWQQAYEAIQNTTTTSMDASRMKVLETFNGMAQDYAQQAQTIVDLENRKGQMVAYLEMVYQQQSAALQAAGQSAQLADLTRAHQAKLKAVYASYDTQIKLERSGQTALLSNAKKYYLTTLQMMARALVAQVATVRANMTALVRMIVSGYGSAAAAAMAFNKIKEGMTDIAAINAAMSEVMSAFSAIEGAGVSAITEASSAFQDWRNSLDDVGTGLDDVGDKLGTIGDQGGSGVKEKLVDPLKAAADVVSGLGDMVKRAIEAFNALAKWGGPETGWVAKFDKLTTALVAMVQRWGRATNEIKGLLESGTREPIMQFAEMVTKVMGAIGAALNALNALADYRATFDNLAELVASIVAFAKMAVSQFAVAANTFKDEVLVKVQSFAEAASAVVKTIGSAIGVLSDLEDVDQDADITAPLTKLVADVKTMVKLFAEADKLFSSQVMAAATSFAETAGKVVAPIKSMVDAFTSLANWTMGRIDPIVELFLLQLRKLARAWKDAAKPFSEDMLEGALWFAGVASKLVAPIKGMADAFEALTKWSLGRIDPIIELFLLQLRKLARAWKDAAVPFNDDMLEGALWFAGVAAKIVAPIKGMAEAFEGIVEWTMGRIDPVVELFLLQLRKLARAWKDAAVPFDDDMMAGAIWFAGVAAKLVAPIKGMVDAFETIVKWTMGRIDPIIELFLLQLRKLARAWAAAAGPFNDDMMEGALWFAGVAAKLVAPITAMVEAFEAIAGWVPARLESVLGGFMLQLRKLARAWAAAAGPFSDEMLAGALWFAGVAAKIVAPITAMVEAFKAIADYVPHVIGPTVRMIADQLLGLTRHWIRIANQFDKDGLAAATAFAEAVRAVVGALSDALELLTKLRTYVSPSYNALSAFERDVEDMLRRLVRWVVFVIQPIAKSVDREIMTAMQEMIRALRDALDLLDGLVNYVSPSQAQLKAFMAGVEQLANDFIKWAKTSGPQLFKLIPPQFLTAFQQLFEGLDKAIDVLNALVDFVAPSESAIKQFEDGYQRLFRNWITWATTTFASLNIELVKELTGVFNDVMNGLRTAIDVLDALVDFVAPSEIAIQLFEDGYQRLFRNWITWATTLFNGMNVELVKAIAGVFNDVMNGLRTAIDVLSALVGFVAPSETAIQEFEDGYQRLFRNWITWVTTTFTDINIEFITAMTTVFDNVMSGLSDAVTVLTQIAGYVSPSEIAIAKFELDYQRLFRNFVTWVTTTFTDINIELITAMGNAMTAVFNGLGAAATTLSKITGYVGPTGATIAQFERDYQRIANDFRDWALRSWTAATAAATTAVGNAIDALYTGLGEAANTLSLIRDYTPPSQAVLSQFMTDMTSVIRTLLAWAQTSFDPQAQLLLTNFGNTIGSLFSGIGTALTTLQGIADYTVSNSDFVLALQRFNANLLMAITSWQTWLVNTFTPETTALVQQFHTIMSTIVADFGAALGLLMDIEQANLPTSEELQAFLDALLALLGGVVNQFDVLTLNLGYAQTILEGVFASIFQYLIDNSATWGANIATVFEGVFEDLYQESYGAGAWAGWRFLEGLLSGMSNITRQNAVIQAMRDLADQLEAELRAAWGIGSPSRVAEGIGKFFVIGLERGLGDLAGIPSLIQQQLAVDNVMLGADVRYSPAPRHDYLTIQFEGAYQSGMSPTEEKRITQAMVSELRRQGLALQVARV